MRSLNFSAYFLSVALAFGCGDKDTGGVGPGGDDDDSTDSADGAKGGTKDGGTKDSGTKKDGGGSSNPTDGSDPGKPTGGIVIVPTSTPFAKDATGASGLSPAVIDSLKAGGSKCTAKVLYPYDKTVFPAGLTPPTIMWDGASDGAYLKLTYNKVDTLNYEAAAGATSQGELAIDPADWNEIVRRTQAGTDMNVTLSTKSGSAISTCNITW
jgi:hypothetical protein